MSKLLILLSFLILLSSCYQQQPLVREEEKIEYSKEFIPPITEYRKKKELLELLNSIRSNSKLNNNNIMDLYIRKKR